MSFLNPVPRFPPYNGPYNVGTALCELKAADLDSPTPCPDASITTVKFRLFYPANDTHTSSNSLRWLPEPHREYLSAYGRFLGAGAFLSEVFSYLPTLISRITIPVNQNVPLKTSPRNTGKWPLLVFSHGLGGSCNSYSHLLASLASHGVVVVAPEHRDGSGPQTFMNDPVKGLRRVEYKNISHKLSPDVEKARNDQLRIRLWELAVIHDAVVRLDRGDAPRNLATPASKHTVTFPDFKSSLGMHEPGRITWAGHSFGASTIVQFVKSVFWDPSAKATSSESLSKFEPLLKFPASARLASQITSASPLVLLDLWTLPLRGDSTLWLWERSLPCYDNKDSQKPCVLAVLSEEFFKWKINFMSTKRALSANPAELEPTSNRHKNEPWIFYPLRSAHLSQSDFGVLFPWITKKWMAADEPERTLRLNARAILQMLRENGTHVEETRKIDAEEELEFEKADINLVKVDSSGTQNAGTQDWNIMTKDGRVRGWVWVSLDEMTSDDKKGKL